MAYKSQIQIQPGKRYHIYNRGAFQQEIFRDNQDCMHFLNLTREYVKMPLLLLAYAVLPNHFHLYIEVEGAARLPAFYRDKPTAIGNRIGHLQNAYAKYFRHKNRTQGKGAVFQGRFGRSEVNDHQYRKNIVHYLNGNAWHHGLVDEPEDYPFTSLQELLFPAVEPYVDTHKVFADFGGAESFQRDWQRVKKKRGLDPGLEWDREEELLPV